MRERGQQLAFEPPHYGTATVGGAVAAGLSGPGRQSAGALRDFILGTRVMDGRGQVLSFGGQVMKNVAGYDVSRLMAGSLGTLGIIVEVSLKALPLPVAEATLRLELPEGRAIEQVNRWGGKPLPISASAWNDGTLGVRLSGASAAVKEACAKIGGSRVEDGQARAFWTGIREHTDRFFRGAVENAAPLWRISVPPTTPALKLQGEQLIEWGGGLRWLLSRADARTVRDAAKRAGGHATLFRGGDKSVGVFQPLAPALMKIHRALKGEFDPQHIFNRGRMYPDF
jgi:glycolate oxidase FAD binding subunit